MRPRTALIESCPWLSKDEASDALRAAGGDLEKARELATTARRIARGVADEGQRRKKQKKGATSGSAANANESFASGQRDGRGEGSAKSSEASKKPAASNPYAQRKKGTAASARSAGANDAREIGRGLDGSRSEDGNGKVPAAPREPPRHSVSINNLSDRQYCCVWSVEVYEDGYRPDVARSLLASVARHVNPILRARGWRVKRLIESSSTQWIGLCTANGRTDADAASTNIQLNLRVRPDRRCTQFRTFRQVLAVMLHEITHTKIGLEDIHPPAFWELLDEIKAEYKQRLESGEVDLEEDDYGCDGMYVSSTGKVAPISSSALDMFDGDDVSSSLGLLGAAGSEGECGARKGRRRRWRGGGNRGGSKGYTSNVPKKEKRRPLLKGSKMIDKRTKTGKASMAERENLSARELAARAALARFGDAGKGSSEKEEADEIVLSSDEDDGDEPIEDHKLGCGCRSCNWGRMFLANEDTCHRL